MNATLTIAALVRDPETGRERGVDLVIDRHGVRLVLWGKGRPSAADITDSAPAIVQALAERTTTS